MADLFSGTPADQVMEPSEAVPQDLPIQPIAAPVKRPPSRRKSFIAASKKQEIATETIKKYDQDIQDRLKWQDDRLQRYAKLRGWLEPKLYPWPGACNAHIPVLMQDSLRTQDTLHNAVLSTRPVMSAQPLHPRDEGKGEEIDHLLDYQLFVEQNGEEKIGDLIDSFVNDGTFVAFIPYVKDDRMVPDVRTFDVMPKDTEPLPYILSLLQQIYPNSIVTSKPGQDYEWDIIAQDDEQRPFAAHVKFYLDEFDRVQMISERSQRVFEGPCLIPKMLEDVVVPSRSANLQPPGPSNPQGAPHVFLVDYPSLDDIKRLVKSGVYDLVSDDDLKLIEARKGNESNSGMDPQSAKVQKDELAGQTFGNADTARDQFTRLMCFDRYDADGDGLDEDVVFWVLKEPGILLRARYLTEQWPSSPPRRPFAEGRFLPVPGQFYGIGLLELMESIYDLIKQTMDQMMDNGALANTPWGFYRAASGVRPEVIRMAAGELYPVADPKNDVAFPQVPNPNQAFGMNVITLLTQFLERLTVIGELQLGRVPYGKASALRTGSTTNALLQQGDARPERILRRFFRGLSEVYQEMHELNQAFLPKGKMYRLAGTIDEQNTPYRSLDDLEKIRGRFQFDFKANVLNTNKAMYLQVMQTIAQTLINGLTLQTGIVDINKMYAILKDLVKALGQEPRKYMNKPTPQADGPAIMWQEAVATILDGQLPEGRPEEGAQAHMQGLMEFQKEPEYAQLIEPFPALKQLFMVYLQRVAQLVKMEMQQQMLLQQANEFASSMGGNGNGGGPQGQPQNPGGNPPVQANEMLAENLPSSGGGASAKS